VNKTEVKKSEIDLLERSHIDSIVLAHLYADLVTQVCGTFGAKPYHAAFEREVKLIGATSHYVTEDPDEGPIIKQDVTRVSHRDQVADLVQRGGIWSG
jgi:formyltetrahydrofolate deformylase